MLGLVSSWFSAKRPTSGDLALATGLAPCHEQAKHDGRLTRIGPTGAIDSFVKKFRLEDWTVWGICYIYVGLQTAARCTGLDVPLVQQEAGKTFWLNSTIEPMLSWVGTCCVRR